MKKAFVLIFSCLLLFLHLHIVRTHYAKNEETNNKDTKLKKKRNSKTFNKKLTNKSFLQVQHTVATRSVPPPPCLGDDCFCQNYYDLTLILDESASIGSKNWKNHVIPFTDKIINDLTISKNEVHVGILLFSSKNRDYVTYGDELRYQKDELLKKVEKLKKDYYCGGGTKILGALKYSLENYTKHKNVRYNAPKVTILFTDGNENSASNKQLLEMGLTYRRERVKLLVLGVAAAEDKKLKLIAGCEENTNCPYSMKAEWETINDITKRLTNKICHTESEIEPEPQPEPSTPTTHCQGDDCFCEDYYDLTLILDESRSITLNKWKNDVVPFAEKVLNNLNIDKDKIHVGIMRFAKSMKTDTGYEQETRYMKNDLIKLVRELKDKYGSGGATHLVDALQYSLKTFTRHPNNRVDAPKVTILFTDGNETSKKEKDIRDIGLLYRKENVKLIVVGVNLATEKSLKLLAGCTENEECLRVIKCEWNDLTNITKILTDKICNTGSVELPKPEENPEPVEKPNPEENPNPVEKPNPEENPNPVEKPEPEKNPCINMDDCYCKDFYDLTLVLDESASISDLIWRNEVIPFALEIIKRINISYKNVHMGVLLFSEYTRDIVRFYDNARYEKGTLQTKINDLKRDYRSGKKTYITQALRYALTYYSKLSNRKEAPKVTMLFTDGNDSNESEKGLNDIALLYRKEHVKLLVIGVSTASENKLKMLVGCATNVVCPFVIKTEWGLLKSVSEMFVKKICDTGVVLPPGSPSESTPGNPSESTPGSPSESSPGNPSESTPGSPSESSPGNPSESTPGSPSESSPCSGTECLCHNTYDLTLIIDESASIGYSNWEKEVVPFTVGIASNLEISEKKVNMGILLFSDKIREFIKYGQKESYDKNNLVRRIHDLKKYYKSGGFSYIVEALKYGLYSYAKSTSTRLDVPKVNILLTDGNNTDTSDFILTEVSSLYKQENVKLLLIGIGGPTIHKLRLLGGCDKSDDDCPYVVKAEWNNLKYTSNLIIDKICHTDTPVEKPGDSSSVCNSKDDCICKNYFDLTYIEVPTLNSTYTWKSEFMDCSKNIMNSIVIDKNKVHASLIISLEKKSVHQGFDDVNSYNKNELIKTLGKLENSMVLNKTNILDSLVYGIQQSFGKGHRENAPKVTILLTNSNSDISDEKALQDIYLNYKERSIKLLIIGIGITNKEKLFHAGGCNMNGNNCPHVYASKSFSYIGGVDTFLEVNKCDNSSSSSDNNGGDNGNGTEGNVNPDTPSCNDNDDDDDKCNNDDSNIICTKVLDIAVVLDQSSNISKDQWNVYVKQFVINTVNQNYLSKYRSHITIVKMGKSTKEKWSLNKKISYQKKKIIKKINKLPISYSKKKDIAKSLKYVRTKVFKKSETNRKKLIIMLVEGKSNSNMNDLRKEVGLLKVNNIDFFAYAIDNIDQTEYKILGDCESSVDMGIMGNSPSSPSYLPCKNIVKVSWDTLLSSTDIHMKYICNGYPEDAECSEWEEWSPCPETCPTINNNNNNNNGSDSNNRTYFPHLSKRERKGPYTLKGEEYMGEKYGSSCMELKSIEYRSCPINAGCNDMCGDFGEWSECSATCGEGIRVRNRDNSLDNDDKCKLFNSTEMEACNIQECDDNNNVDICEDIGEWSDWSSCSKTCGYSTRSRTFTILPEYIGEYPNCKTFERSETEVCAFIPACSDETCFEWEEWNEWSSPCSPRKRVQKARVLKNNGVINSSGDNNNNNNNNAKRGMEHAHSTFTSYNNKKSDICEEEVRHYLNKVEYDEESTCENKNPCGDWSDWSECDRTCNVGVRIRHFISHMFDMVADEDEKECLEYYNKVETEDCLHLPPCDGGECSDWETWVECKEEDMIGNNCHKPNKKILTRKLELLKNKDITRSKNTSDVCNDYTLFREEDCPQSNDTCINALCNEWEEWGDCSSTCGEGSFKIRKRKAPLELIPASQDINGNIGLTCAQQNIKVEEREACIVPACDDESTNGGTVVDGSTTPSSPSDSNNNDGSSGNNTGDSNDKKGMGTGEKVSIAAGVIGLVALAAGGLIYGYNTLNGGEPPHSSNMEFENVENNTGAEEQENEDFEVVDADDPMWN